MNNKSIMIKPKRGLKVFNPSKKLHVKESGELVVMSNYWKRRLKDDEIEIIKPIKKAKKEVKEEMKEKPIKKSKNIGGK